MMKPKEFVEAVLDGRLQTYLADPEQPGFQALEVDQAHLINFLTAFLGRSPQKRGRKQDRFDA